MDTVPYSHLGKGTFLIASPEMTEGLYFRTVVLICEHSPNGSFGLVINKPLEVELPEDVINLKEVANPHIQVRAGGPIQPNQMMLVHSSESPAELVLKICEGVYLGGDLQFLEEAMHNPNGPYISLFFGYVGWGPGQLETEFLSGSWFIQPASSKHLFETPSEKVWQILLREMGGKYATLSMIPEDLSLKLGFDFQMRENRVGSKAY